MAMRGKNGTGEGVRSHEWRCHGLRGIVAVRWRRVVADREGETRTMVHGWDRGKLE